MAGFAHGVLEPDQWAHSPAELSRVIGDQLDDDATLNAPGRLGWVAARWDGPVLLDAANLGRRVDGWRAELGGLPRYS